MKRVAAVIVTYNRLELLLQCIDCLRASEGLQELDAQLDILIMDNASTDGTGDAIAALPQVDAFPVIYQNTGANLGGAGGFNYGIRKAMEAGCYDYIWIMDDDCLVHPDSLAGLLAADQKLGGPEAYGWLSSVVRWTDGSICLLNVQRHPIHTNITDFSPALQPCTLASFVSLFVPTVQVKRFGLPFKEFFIWTDDWEYTRRISRERPCYLVGESVVTHASAANSTDRSIMATDPSRLDRCNYVYRNDVVLYRGEGFSGYWYIFKRNLYHTFKVLTARGLEGKGRRIGIIWGATRKGFAFHPDIEYV